MTLRACRAASGGLEGTVGAPQALDAVLARAEQGELTRPERLLLAHGALLRALSGTAIDEVRRLARLAVDGAEPDPGNSTDLIVLTHVAVALVAADELELAERVTTAAIDRVRELGSAIGFATLSHLRAWAHYRAGHLGEAIADAQSVLDGARYGWEPALPAAHAVIALALLERGDLAGAETALELPGGGDRWRTTFTWNDYVEARGELRLASGDVEAALADFEECGRGLAAAGADHPSVVPWRSGAARACAQLGDSVRARRLADDDIERARAFGAPRAVGAALRTAGAIAGGDRGVELLREACEVLADSEGVLEYARALADLGAALLAQQHRLAATEPLRMALDLANRCGAKALEEKVRALLLTVGARPRRAAVAGRDALTPRERRLAEMAAEGHTNREIAEALFITTKTVETHLRHVFEKLAIGSRRELPEALARDRD
jgi:DNA-binding CsgD family transcriptional regulator